MNILEKLSPKLLRISFIIGIIGMFVFLVLGGATGRPAFSGILDARRVYLGSRWPIYPEMKIVVELHPPEIQDVNTLRIEITDVTYFDPLEVFDRNQLIFFTEMNGFIKTYI